ncbi:hypothetical protein D3C78_1019940 [compost metagenome]
MARNEERNDLEADILIVQRFTCSRVHAAEHMAEQILLTLISTGFALCNDLIDQCIHDSDVMLELPPGNDHQLVLNTKTLQLAHRLAQRSDHACNKRMRLLAIEAVEAIIKAAQADRIQGEPGHILRNIHLLIGIEA